MDKNAPKLTQNVLFDSIFVSNEIVFLEGESADSITNMSVIVNPTLTEMKYIFQYYDRSDTLVLGYTNQTIVLSPDCGSYLFQDNLQVKHSTFDSVHIVNQRLLTSADVNVEIFL